MGLAIEFELQSLRDGFVSAIEEVVDVLLARIQAIEAIRGCRRGQKVANSRHLVDITITRVTVVVHRVYIVATF